jgi:hypothetical protein
MTSGGQLMTQKDNSKDYDLRLDPPVNRRIPIARDRLEKVLHILGV